MKIQKFVINNFKGIKHTVIDVSTQPPGNVITLIGLNESGKTTVLEAISNFVSADRETSSIVRTVMNQQRPVDLIPKALETNFTGEISVRADVELDDSDVDDLAQSLKEELQITLDKSSCPRKFFLRRAHVFKDSDFVATHHIWSPTFDFTKQKGKKKLHASGRENRDVWDAATRILQGKFPKIVYFPTFLFNIPDRIYLEDHPSWSKDDEAFIINSYFKQVLQDVADSLESNISLKAHIVDRISRHRDDVANPLQFLATFMGMDDATRVRAVTNRLAGKIGRVVFDAWNEISGRKVTGKSVRIDWFVDAEAGNIPYLQLLIHDGEQDYALHERSLGFRWFFTFLLFTQFRVSRKSERGTIFLFDEPAANLHARAQTKLLDSFGRIATGNKFIIYSTHSHYMIEPLWLEKSVIVENAAVEFGDDDVDEIFDVRHTDIRVSRYRNFVAQNPKRISYFQPALDALKFSFGPLMPGENAVIVEGKFDFHPLRYFQNRFDDLSFSIIPAPSASEAGTLISLLRGLGTNFIVLLDDDRAGRTAGKSYRDHHLLDESQVVRLSDLSTKCLGRPFEALYGDEVKALVKIDGQPEPNKGQYSLLFQELMATKNFGIELGGTTEAAMDIIQGIKSNLGLTGDALTKKNPIKKRRLS